MQITPVSYNYTNQNTQQKKQQNFGELAFTSPQAKVKLYRKIKQSTTRFHQYFANLMAANKQIKPKIITDGDTLIIGTTPQPISTMTVLEELCGKLERTLDHRAKLHRTDRSLVSLLKESPIVQVENL